MFAFFLLLLPCSAFYLPGVAPRDYQVGEFIDIKVVKLDSVKTQLPYDYYALPFCRPNHITEAAENLGEILSGDQIETSAYEVSMKIPLHCNILCKLKYSASDLSHFETKIKEEYRVNWIVDNIPAATRYYEQLNDNTNGASYVP